MNYMGYVNQFTVFCFVDVGVLFLLRGGGGGGGDGGIGAVN